MAGLGRRTHYRKHLTDSVLNDFPEPNPPHSRLAKILGTRGSNQFDVRLAAGSNNYKNNGDGQDELAILPTKFRKLVWLKRNDFVIVETADNVDEPHHHHDQPPQEGTATTETSSTTTPNSNNNNNNSNDTAGIRCMIAHILYHEQIKHLMAKGLWPEDDPEFAVEDRKLQESAASNQPKADKDGIVFEEQYMPQNSSDNEEDYYDEGHEVGFDDDDDDNDNNPIQPADDPMLFVNTNRLARLTVQDSSSDEEEEEES